MTHRPFSQSDFLVDDDRWRVVAFGFSSLLGDDLVAGA